MDKSILQCILGFSIGMVICELYKRGMTEEAKKKWENTIKIHHGEAGLIMVGVGGLTKSPFFIGLGLALSLHDIDDINMWFQLSLGATDELNAGL